MRPRSLAAVLVVALLVPAAARGQRLLTGQVDAELVPDWLETSVGMIQMAPAEASAHLGGICPSGARVWSGPLRVRGQAQSAYLIELAPGKYAVVADLDGDGTLTNPEMVPLQPAANDDWRAIQSATLRFATRWRAFPVFPVRVGVMELPPAIASRVFLRQSLAAFVAGTFELDGRRVAWRVIVKARTLSANVATGYQYIDCNGDGKIDDSETSPEMGYAEGQPVVFHVERKDRYVSLSDLDLDRKTVALKTHPASDYDRIELRPGRAVPDFEFTALDGSRRKLSDYRGKYVLLDFWGTWCGPCVAHLPSLKRALQAYKDRGFDILGMDCEMPDETVADLEAGLAKVKAFVAERGIPWTQARTASIRDLYQRRFMIVGYPTYVLIDPKGRIVAVNKGLEGDDLEKTLAALLKGR